MIRAEQIPDEVVEAMSEADHGTTTYAELLAAALNAWPDAFVTKYSEGAPAFNIPLPQENTNAEA